MSNVVKERDVLADSAHAWAFHGVFCLMIVIMEIRLGSQAQELSAAGMPLNLPLPVSHSRDLLLHFRSCQSCWSPDHPAGRAARSRGANEAQFLG